MVGIFYGHCAVLYNDRFARQTDDAFDDIVSCWGMKMVGEFVDNEVVAGVERRQHGCARDDVRFGNEPAERQDNNDSDEKKSDELAQKGGLLRSSDRGRRGGLLVFGIFHYGYYMGEGRLTQVNKLL